MRKPQKKRRRPRVPVVDASSASASIAQSDGPTHSTAIAPIQTKSRATRTFAYLATSAIDYGLEHAWGFLGGAFVAALGLVTIYVRSGRAKWLYPWLTHAAAFTAGVFSILVLMIVLAAVRERKRSRERIALENAKNLRFVSNQPGFIDFFANKEKAEAQLAKVLIPINEEIAGLGKSAAKQVGKITPNTSFTKRQEIATETASVLNDHSYRIEKHWKTFAELDDTLSESNVGCVNWLNLEDASHREMLVQQRQGSMRLITAMEETLPSLQALRNTVATLKGFSQNMNGAVAHLTFVLDGLIGALRKSESRWRNLIALIDRKDKSF